MVRHIQHSSFTLTTPHQFFFYFTPIVSFLTNIDFICSNQIEKVSIRRVLKMINFYKINKTKGNNLRSNI